MYGGDKRRNNKETGKELMVEEKKWGQMTGGEIKRKVEKTWKEEMDKSKSRITDYRRIKKKCREEKSRSKDSWKSWGTLRLVKTAQWSELKVKTNKEIKWDHLVADIMLKHNPVTQRVPMIKTKLCTSPTSFSFPLSHFPFLSLACFPLKPKISLSSLCTQNPCMCQNPTALSVRVLALT